MADLNSLVRNHIDYNAWASSRLLEAAAQLSPEELQRDFGTADKGIQGTLTHLFRAERIWLRRILEGIPAIPFALPGDEQWAALIVEWPKLHRQWQDWARGLSATDVEEMLAYTDLENNPWKQPVWQVVLHLVNHSTHHRGQVAGFLRASGHIPPPLDFIAYMRLSLPA
jgi:uncharacterized damage-inducible protein DinB